MDPFQYRVGYKYFRNIVLHIAGITQINEIAAYIRVSTEKQKKEGSHENQKDAIRSWAERNDYDPDSIKFFEGIGISGQSANRDDYDELMDRYEEFEVVVVRELSRFGRDPLRVLQDIEEITESDTEFVSVTENFDTSSAMGRVFVRMVAVINGMYSDLRREQAERMHERRKEQGLPVGRPKKLDDGELEDVIEWREMGMSYSQIAALIQETHGKEVHRSTVYRYCEELTA